MKKAILIFIAAWLLTGCLSENRDDCDAYLKLTFQYKNSTDKFDAIIKNDVSVRLYLDDKLYQNLLIPYEQIAGGKEYCIRKTFSGQLSIAAWAVPTSGSQETIPDVNKQVAFSSSVIQDEVQVYGTSEYYTSMNDLYLGTVKDAHEESGQESSYVVSMTDVTCRLNVSAHPLLFPNLEITPHLEIAGVASEVSLDLEPLGEEAIVYTDLDKKSDEWFKSSSGLLTSYDEHTVSLTAFSDDVRLFTVDTEELSEPGKVINVVIWGTTAEIFVNGYRVRNVQIQL